MWMWNWPVRDIAKCGRSCLTDSALVSMKVGLHSSDFLSFWLCGINLTKPNSARQWIGLGECDSFYYFYLRGIVGF